MKHLDCIFWNLLKHGLASMIVLACTCCACCPKGTSQPVLTEVWTQPGWPPEDLPPPETFKLAPRQAYAVVAESKKLSLKHPWFCFRDSRFYYIADAFGKSINPKMALRHGVRVNGITGIIE